MTRRLLELEEVLVVLRRAVERAGGQSEWAKGAGVNRTFLNKVLNGKQAPGRAILKALKLRKTLAYVPEERNE